MANEITAQQRFEEKLYSRLRDDVADLLPDDVLSEMAHRAIEKMFFQPRVITTGSGYHEKTTKAPSWFEEKVEKLLRERLDAMAKQWLADNAETLSDSFANVMQAKMPHIVATALFKPVDLAIYNIEQRLQEGIVNYMEERLNGNQFPTFGN